jgi:CheY-like chemotaxis protein
MLDLVQRNDQPTVLLIDDDMVSREVIATVLTMGGYPVHTAENGESALKMLAAKVCDPGVILVDAQMPGLSGSALVTRLRAAAKAPIIAISASAPPRSMVTAADAVLLKPFTPDDLTALMARVSSVRPAARPKQPERPAEPVVNPQTLAQLRDMMPEIAVRQIYEAIVADLERRLKGIRSAIQRNEPAEVRRLGHAIKGGSSMAGAAQAARLGALIEEGALEIVDAHGNINHLDNSSPLLEELHVAAENLKRMLEAGLPS